MKKQLKHILLVNNAPHVKNVVDSLVAEQGYALQRADEEQDLMAMIEQVSPDLLMILVQLGTQVEEEQLEGKHNDNQ